MTTKHTFDPAAFGITTGAGKLDGRQVARAWAQWYLGYREWGDQLVDAYLEPEKALQRLRAAYEAPSS